jgi:hypothetical protein
MNRRFLLTVFATIPLLLSGCATSTHGVDDSKIGKLASELGMTTEQAQAGVGAMLKVSEVRLDPAQYDRIASVIPRGDEYVELARRLGAFQGAVPTSEGLGSAFAALGVTPEQAARFVPAVTDYVSTAAGRDVGMSMANALK